MSTIILLQALNQGSYLELKNDDPDHAQSESRVTRHNVHWVNVH